MRTLAFENVRVDVGVNSALCVYAFKCMCVGVWMCGCARSASHQSPS